MAEVDLDRLAAGYRHRPPSRASLERARRQGKASTLDRRSWTSVAGLGTTPECGGTWDTAR